MDCVQGVLYRLGQPWIKDFGKIGSGSRKERQKRMVGDNRDLYWENWCTVLNAVLVLENQGNSDIGHFAVINNSSNSSNLTENKVINNFNNTNHMLFNICVSLFYNFY